MTLPLCHEELARLQHNWSKLFCGLVSDDLFCKYIDMKKYDDTMVSEMLSSPNPSTHTHSLTTLTRWIDSSPGCIWWFPQCLSSSSTTHKHLPSLALLLLLGVSKKDDLSLIPLSPKKMEQVSVAQKGPGLRLKPKKLFQLQLLCSDRRGLWIWMRSEDHRGTWQA